MDDRSKNKCKYYDNSTPLFYFKIQFFFHIVDTKSYVLKDPLLFSLFCFAFLFLLYSFFSIHIFFFKTEEVNYENEIQNKKIKTVQITNRKF